MGGRALKNTVTRRYERAEFEDISFDLIEILDQTFPRVNMPRFYSFKESFGDADILILNDRNIDMHDYIKETFKPNEIFHNGSCWSFDYHELQVDLIVCPAEHYDTSLMYFSYNDLGNYIGRLAHRFGLKYGQEGLWLEYNFKGSNVGKIEVSKNYPKIFEFLGLSYDRYKKGFNTLEDIFVFIVNSPYFNWKMFQLSELNKINRDRNAKRASYMSFLKWIDENVANEEHECPVAEDKSIYLETIDEFFPEANIETEIKRLEYETCRELYIKAKFNGGMIRKQFGFQGKELGEKINGFKDYVNEFEPYDEYILKNDTDTIIEFFKTYLQSRVI